MVAIVRLKRRRDEEQAESLILSSKRRKLDEEKGSSDFECDDDTEVRLKFAGTVKTQGESLSAVNRAIALEQLENSYKSRNIQTRTNPGKKLKKECLGKSKSCQVVSSVYSDNLNDLFRESAQSNPMRHQLLDVERTDEKMSDVKDDGSVHGYVYDIFYIDKLNFNDTLMKGLGIVEAFYASETNNEEDEEVEKWAAEDDDADENDESDWKTDYPDEYNCFYESDHENEFGDEDENDGDDDDDDKADKDDQSSHKEDCDYGDYLGDFMNQVLESKDVKKDKNISVNPLYKLYKDKYFGK